MVDLAVVAVVLALVAATRLLIHDLPLTSPMIFVAAGLLLGPDLLGVIAIELESESVAILAELTLALLLFSDASRIDVRRLRRSIGLPARLLAIGLPLTVILTTLLAAAFLTQLTWAEAALIAAVLTPTDAALGQAVVTNKSVPLRVRQALNVEAGLNDGMIVPVVTIFLSLAVGEELNDVREFVLEALAEIGLGIAVGILGALVLARLTTLAMRHNWTDDEGYRLVMLGGAIAAYAGADAVGGNGFIAAFLCGLFVRSFVGKSIDKQTELAEDAGQIGAAATFIVFGALLVWPAFENVTVAVAICALAILTVGRMLPVTVSMVGTGLKLPTVAFIGWFGPRGLASMVFGLLILQEESLVGRDALFSVVVIVIVASVALHGVTAAPMAARYARWYEHHGVPDMEESLHVERAMLRGERSD